MRFLTLFRLSLKNEYLTKDAGMIPYTLHKKYGWDSHIAAIFDAQNLCNTDENSFIEKNFPYLQKEVYGLKLTAIKSKTKSMGPPQLTNYIYPVL